MFCCTVSVIVMYPMLSIITVSLYMFLLINKAVSVFIYNTIPRKPDGISYDYSINMGFFDALDDLLTALSGQDKNNNQYNKDCNKL